MLHEHFLLHTEDFIDFETKKLVLISYNQFKFLLKAFEDSAQFFNVFFVLFFKNSVVFHKLGNSNKNRFIDRNILAYKAFIYVTHQTN